MNETEIEEFRAWVITVKEEKGWLLHHLLMSEINNHGVIRGCMPFPWPWKHKEIEFLENELLRHDARISIIEEVMGVEKSVRLL